MHSQVNISEIFNKRFQFKSFNSIPENAFKSKEWSIPELQKKKIQLNNIKAQLGKYNLEEWSKHTKHKDPSSFVIRNLKTKFDVELATQAWCKFYECLNQFKIIPDLNKLKNFKKFTSLHLCEAPGAFISAFNHYVKSNYDNFNWEWIASTLNPDYSGNKLTEMIPDDRLIRMTPKKWYFGCDYTGDLTKYYNYLDLTEKITDKVLLVTADGSIDCMSQPGKQEMFVEYLHYCETITAISTLQVEGSFILKMFTIFEHSSICLLYLLNVLFDSVTAFKPCTSKGGNSEIYIICTSFKGLKQIEKIWESLKVPYQNGFFENNSMFNLKEIPIDFIKDIERCSEYFMNLQIETITNNIECFRKRNPLFLSSIHHLKIRVANMFLKKYKLKSIPPTYKLVPFTNLNDYHFTIENDIDTLLYYKNFNLIDKSENIIQIKYGKKIEILGFSYFCPIKCFNTLNLFRKSNQDRYSLYNRAFIQVNRNYLIINKNDFDCISYHQFQWEFFNFFVCHPLDKNLIIMDVPLLTNFLVGIVYLLCIVYEDISVHCNGSITLNNLKPEMLEKWKANVIQIKNCYDNLPKNISYDIDIIEIIPMNFILYNKFHTVIYNYNRSVLYKGKS